MVVAPSPRAGITLQRGSALAELVDLGSMQVSEDPVVDCLVCLHTTLGQAR